MYNKVILIGHLTKDIELQYLQSSLALSKGSLATNRRYKDKQGNLSEEVTYIDISLFGRSAEVANQYLRKGSKVLVEGRLKFEQWLDKNGTQRSKHSIVVENMQMLDNKPEYTNTKQQEEPNAQTPHKLMQEPQIKEIDIDADDIPF